MKVLQKNQYIVFICEYCLKKKGNEHSDLNEIKEMLKVNLKETKQSMANLKDEILGMVNEAIEEKLQKQDETQKRLENMMTEVKDAEVNIEKKIKAEVEMYLDKRHDKENRKCNLIIQRLQETYADEKQQQEKDKEDVLKILELTNPEMKAEFETMFTEKKRIKRLGNKTKADKSKKTRPIRVVLNDEEMKFDIFKGCKNLKSSDFERISIQNDLSLDEQEQNFKLRKEYKERKEAGEDICIFRNKIIPTSERPAKEDSE